MAAAVVAVGAAVVAAGAAVVAAGAKVVADLVLLPQAAPTMERPTAKLIRETRFDFIV
jgi:hypothetical protein